MEAELEMEADACVVVSGLPDGVNSWALREHFRTGNGDSGIKQLVTFPKLGTALVEVLTPEDAADVLANGAHVQVRALRSVIPKHEDVTIQPGLTGVWTVIGDLWTFLESLPRPRDHVEQKLESGASWESMGIDDVADLGMDADACVVVSGLPGYVNNYMFHIWISQAECIRQAAVFPATGTALMEFFTPEWADNFLAHQNRLFEETGLRAKNLTHLFSPNDNATTSQRQLSQLKQQLESAKQNLRNKEQQLQSMLTENERLKTVHLREKTHLKNELTREKQAKGCALNQCQRLEQGNMHLTSQIEDDKKEIERLKKRIASASNEISRSREMLTSNEQQLQRVTTENEGLMTTLRREEEAKRSSFALRRKLEEENVHLNNQAEAYKRENKRLKTQAEADKTEKERLKEQISILYEMSRDPRGVVNRDGTEEDTDARRHFHFIKENVTAEWKDLAVKLGLSWADVTNIEGRNRDDKSRCWDALQEWRKRKGEEATIDVLMEALEDLELTSVVDGLKTKYQGPKLSTHCSE
ncbi:myosin-2 heavy chain-like [Branchiostoma lanceolatum]|uniref:myosin-2 heavy chain-like n=1 Tax=Branchiostoma lanceolatum TaxID=7740 RepID=UPI00345212A1